MIPAILLASILAVPFEGSSGNWVVGEAGGTKGLMVDGSRNAAAYPLAIYQGECAGDRTLSVRFFPIAGRIDQGAGIAFGIDKDGNYWGVRANALEDNVLFFKVVKGRREVIEEVGSPAPPRHAWSELKLRITGTKLVAELNGKVVMSPGLERSPSGRCGLWSKADSKVLFDDFQAVAPAAAIISNEAPLRTIQIIGLPGVVKRIDHLAIDRTGQRLFVAALGNGTLEVVDLRAGKPIRSLSGLTEPQGLAYLPEFHRIVVATAGGSVIAFDDRTFAVVGKIDSLDDADNVRYDAAAKRLYAGYGDGALAVIDPATMRRLGDLKLPGHPESFQMETAGPLIYVNVPTRKEVVVLDRNKRAALPSIPLPDFKANFPMAFDDAGHRLFIGTRAPARLVIVDTLSRAVASAECMGDADDLFYDATRGRLYLTGGEGFADVFDARPGSNNPYARLAHIPTAPGARSSLWVPELGRLYIAAPRREGHDAAIHVLEAPPVR